MNQLTELQEWQQAAEVEAGLRREFLARAEKAEAEVERLRGMLPVLANADAEHDFVEVVEGFTRFVQNERVRSYNEGIDTERRRCSDIAIAIDSGRGNEKEIASAILSGFSAHASPMNPVNK